MDFFSKRAVMTDTRLAHAPGKINLPAVVRPEELHVPSFNIAEKTTPREDRVDVLGEFFDRLLKRVNAVLQIIFFFEEAVVPLGHADKFVHEKKIVGAAVGLFLGPEELQAFFKLRHERVGFLEGKGPAFFLSHRSVLPTG